MLIDVSKPRDKETPPEKRRRMGLVYRKEMGNIDPEIFGLSDEYIADLSNTPIYGSLQNEKEVERHNKKANKVIRALADVMLEYYPKGSVRLSQGFGNDADTVEIGGLCLRLQYFGTSRTRKEYSLEQEMAPMESTL